MSCGLIGLHGRCGCGDVQTPLIISLKFFMLNVEKFFKSQRINETNDVNQILTEFQFLKSLVLCLLCLDFEQTHSTFLDFFSGT
jgi:mRNA deadenylase 3'-5' endonuclease subunit Ccr4